MSTKLSTQRREKVGTRASRALRAEGRIPGNLQGGTDQPHVDLSIDEEEFLTARRHHQHLYELDFDGKVETALIEELQWDTFGERIQHVEFRRVDRHQKTDVVVPLEFYGDPKGGVLMHALNEVTIMTTPDSIPDSIVVKVGELEVGGSITLGQLELPEGMTLSEKMDAEEVVAHVIEPKEEAAEPAAEGAEGEEAAAPAEAPKPEGDAG